MSSHSVFTTTTRVYFKSCGTSSRFEYKEPVLWNTNCLYNWNLWILRTRYLNIFVKEQLILLRFYITKLKPGLIQILDTSRVAFCSRHQMTNSLRIMIHRSFTVFSHPIFVQGHNILFGQNRIFVSIIGF